MVTIFDDVRSDSRLVELQNIVRLKRGPLQEKHLASSVDPGPIIFGALRMRYSRNRYYGNPLFEPIQGGPHRARMSNL